jgi:hypothetical protein
VLHFSVAPIKREFKTEFKTEPMHHETKYSPSSSYSYDRGCFFLHTLINIDCFLDLYAMKTKNSKSTFKNNNFGPRFIGIENNLPSISGNEGRAASPYSPSRLSPEPDSPVAAPPVYSAPPPSMLVPPFPPPALTSAPPPPLMMAAPAMMAFAAPPPQSAPPPPPPMALMSVPPPNLSAPPPPMQFLQQPPPPPQQFVMEQQQQEVAKGEVSALEFCQVVFLLCFFLV